jgi:hypothetical protein
MIEYKTKDLIVATYLNYKEVKFVREYEKDSKCWVFDNSDGICASLELELRNGDALVLASKWELARRTVLAMTSRG